MDKWSPLPSPDSYQGYGITVYHNDRTFNATTLCKGGSASLTVVPPASITVTGKDSSTVTYGPSNPITNANMSAVDSRGWCGDSSDPGSGLGVGGTGEPPYVMGFFKDLKQSISGDWIVKKDNTAIAWFDIGMTAPFFDADTSKPIRAPVPRARITLDAERKITKLEISWWLYDLAGATYVELTDLTAVQRLLGGAFHIGINDGQLKKEEKILSNKTIDEPMQTSFTSFATPWRLPTTPGTEENAVRDIRIMYTIGRTSLTVYLTDL